MNHNQKTSDQSSWLGRYDYLIPNQQGRIIDIEGVGENDSYNPVICDYNGTKILAFRCEPRNSFIYDSLNYHPTIIFAKNDGDKWKVSNDIKTFDRLEDPLFCQFNSKEGDGVIFGGVSAELIAEGEVTVNTELYKGSSLETLERIPFAIINGMKDERLSQLPDGRFLLCTRPLDEKGMGRVVISIINDLSDLKSINTVCIESVVELSGPYIGDWVGVNNIYFINDADGTAWVGLLGHVANNDENNIKHYAVTTYKIKLDELFAGQVGNIKPHVIATRSCFETGPRKNDQLWDVVFPGSLEKIGDNRYRLWAGLSDARIGVIELDDPFRFN